MSKAKLPDSWLAILMLALGLSCFRGAYFASPRVNPEAMSAFEGWASGTVRLCILLVVGIGCIGAAFWIWQTRHLALDIQAPARQPHRFGRNAATGAGSARKPKARPVSFILAVLSVCVLALDYQFPAYLPSNAAIADNEHKVEEIAAKPAEPAAKQDDVQSRDSENVTKPTEIAQDQSAAEPVVKEPDPAVEQSKADETAALQQPVSVPETVVALPKPEPVPTQPQGHRDAVVWLAVSPDRQFVLSASTDRMIKLWSIDGSPIRDLGAHKDMARTALFLPGGARALTAGDDGEIVLRSLPDGAVLHVFSAKEHGGANKVAISGDGRRAVSGHEVGTVIVWDLENKTALHVLNGQDWSISSVAVSPDGRLALSGSIDGTLKLWDIDQGRRLRSWRGHERGTYGMAFTADGRQVVTGSGDTTIKLWDVETGKEIRRFEGHSGTVYALVLSDDGKQILSGSLDGTARLWDMATGRQLAELDAHIGPVYSVAFGAGGTVLTGGADHTIRVWPAGGGTSTVLVMRAPD